jgi:NAD+ kinase
MTAAPPLRVALVVHPARPIAEPLAVLERWAGEHRLDVVQIHPETPIDRTFAPGGEVQPGDLVVALGGDGTVLSALRAAAPVDAPVLGAACGSLGILSTVPAAEFGDALERVYAGEWTPKRLPVLAIQPGAGPGEWALNDFVAVRHGPGQLVADVHVDDELYVRLAGDGLIVATALGSSGYSMAAGGPLLMGSPAAFVFTPLAMHGGNAPPLVVPATSTLSVELHPGFAGFEIEIDGHDRAARELAYTITLQEGKATLVAFGPGSARLTRLRARRVISDSARILARDERAVPAQRQSSSSGERSSTSSWSSGGGGGGGDAAAPGGAGATRGSTSGGSG